MLRKFSTPFFYLGTFITSFGGLLFVMCIPAFFLKVGYAAELIGITIGVHRFSGIIASAFFGPKIDSFNSRRVIFITEFLAALTSAGLIYCWVSRETLGLIPFWVFVGLRALVVGVQSTSRNRLVKLLSQDNQTREASFVIWLNKVTQGAHILSSLVAIPLLLKGNLVIAICIDSVSFLIGGYSAFFLPDLDSGNKPAASASTIVTSFLNLLKTHKYIFIQDQLLALAISGTILLMVKLSGGNSDFVIYFNLLFGACIWISSIFAHNVSLRNRTLIYWALMLVGFIMLAQTFNSNWRFFSYFITYMGYWILYHKYTVAIQTNSPKESVGAMMAIRGLTMAITLSLGELLGGYMNKVFDLKTELILRAIICGFVLVALKAKPVLNKDEI